MKTLSVRQAIDSDSLYSDAHLTKSEIALALKTSRPTICRLDKIAYLMVKTYRESYPMETDPIKRRKNSRQRTVPLTPYQIWVLSRVWVLMKAFKDATRIKVYINSNQNLFSLICYESKFNQVNHQGA